MVRAGAGRRTPLDDVDHLARSPHRAQVIQLLADGDWTRRGLHEATDIPQPTLGRILGSFQERHWLERDGQTYSLTLHGRLVASHFVDFLDVVETIQQLPTTADYEPLLELGFEPDWLTRMEVTTADTDPYAHIRRARDVVKSSDRIREVSPGPMPGMAEVISERLHAGELIIETVFPREAVEAFIADPENRSLLVGILETGECQLHLLDGEIRNYVARQGDRAVFEVDSVEGGPIAHLTTTDSAVLEWAESIVDDFRKRAEPVTVEELRE